MNLAHAGNEAEPHRPLVATAEELRAILDRAAVALLQHLPTALVVMCGSLARNDFVSGWSDVDLIAVVARDDDDRSLERWRLSAFSHYEIELGIRRVTRAALDWTEKSESSHGTDLVLYSDVPSGMAKVVEALLTIGADSQILCGDPFELRLSQGSLRRVQVAGIRDAIVAMHRSLQSGADSPLKLIDCRKRIGQVTNLCRIALRMSGFTGTLTHRTTQLAAESMSLLPGTTIHFLKDAVHFRECLVATSESWHEDAHKLAGRAFGVFEETLAHLRVKWPDLPIWQ
jgi:predicted nucleotidyltransferase